MNISLREITPQNFRECINLKVAEEQGKFVASNVMSLAQAKVYPTYLPFAIYAGDQMVGFVMYGFDPDDKRYYLGRLMIDEKHQGKGYGKAAALHIIEQMKKFEDCSEFFLSVVPGNTTAEKLYTSIGFEKTDETNESGEFIMRLAVKENATDNRAMSADN